MTTELITSLIALLDRWNTLADKSAQLVDAIPLPVMGGFYIGMMYGMESAHDELTAAMAEAAQPVKPYPIATCIRQGLKLPY